MILWTHHPSLLNVILVLGALCSMIMARPHELQGNYTLARLIDATQTNVSLQSRTYTFRLAFDQETKRGAVFSFGIVIGNSIGGTIILNEANGTIEETTSWSTRMYPGPELYEIEVALLGAISEAAFVQERGNRTVAFYGEGGSFHLKRKPWWRKSYRNETTRLKGTGMNHKR